MSKSKIPTEEEFARASAALESGSRGLSQIRENILCNYAQKYKLHEFFIFDSTETSFRAYVFFKKEKDVRNAKSKGLAEEIKSMVYRELKDANRGVRGNIDLFVEFDSHENIEDNFDGDYFDRLR